MVDKFRTKKKTQSCKTSLIYGVQHIHIAIMPKISPSNIPSKK